MDVVENIGEELGFVSTTTSFASRILFLEYLADV